jgi:hypothetical protein
MKNLLVPAAIRVDSARVLLAAVLSAAPLAQAAMPAMPEIPVTLPEGVRQPLIAKRQPLALRKLALIDEATAINTSCASVVKGSSPHQICLARQKQFNELIEALSVAMDALADEIDAAVTRYATISRMNAMANRLGWSADEQTRLSLALNALAFDGEPNVASTEIRRAWQDVLARGPGGDIARSAALGDGPGLPGAGQQTAYADCAIFALANATGLPYGVVAARAAKLIGEGDWRDGAERANPQKAIEQKGLIGGEVVMLAEAFGQVEVVPRTAFAKTLKEGRTVMINVVPTDGSLGSGHQVVLTKAFQHGGASWYEMVDSNQGALRRLYLSARELDTLLQENGVAFRPESGTTPMLLR